MKILVTDQPIQNLDPREHLDLNNQAGAIVSFTGLVREFGGGLFELEHYPQMTEKMLERIAREAKARFDLIDGSIMHRVGAMNVTDIIVLVCAASKHRQNAFDGANYMMDYLKTRAPFWKKEGDQNWVDAKDDDEKALNKWRKL